MDIQLMLAFLIIWLLVTAVMSFVNAYPDRGIASGFIVAIATQFMIAVFIGVILALSWAIGTIVEFALI